MNNTNISLEHIIAKIDNDFNPDNSDWIPRIAPWCVDALNQLKLLRKYTKKRKLTVNNRIAKSKCCIIEDDFKVYDSDGCEVPRLEETRCNCSSNDNVDDDYESSSTGTAENKSTCLNINNKLVNGSKTVRYDNDNDINIPVVHTDTNISRDPRCEHTTYSYSQRVPRGGMKYEHNYVLVDGNTIELNFDDTFITITNKEIETKYSETYHCEVPVIPNNGLLIEAITYFCMYKMLCRGYKHPVLNLNASQYGTNPYYEWINRIDKVKTSVLLDSQTDDNGAWRDMFYNSTFPKK